MSSLSRQSPAAIILFAINIVLLTISYFFGASWLLIPGVACLAIGWVLLILVRVKTKAQESVSRTSNDENAEI